MVFESTILHLLCDIFVLVFVASPFASGVPDKKLFVLVIIPSLCSYIVSLIHIDME